ncbi:MAG: glycosyltransferase family 39 protein, partial [Anaerolineae bacterium]
LYWMPLTAILGWLGVQVLGNSFAAIQAPFVLLSALLPRVAYTVAWDLTGQRKHAVLAGLLSLFPGFSAHVFVLPDNFAPFALAGSVCLWSTGRGLRERKPLWFGLAGLTAGLAHLSRADGLLLAGIALVAVWIQGLFAFRERAKLRQTARTLLAGMALLVSGYLLVMGPWFVRNWLVTGTPLGGSGLKTIFLTTYDDMFAYGRPLTLENYLAWGWGEILRSKAQALLFNLQRFWVENLLVVLLPFSALGLWNLRRERLLWPFLLYLPLLFLAMTLVFTFPGIRGGLFHSGGALLPFLFAAAGPGLEVALRWAARRFRSWHIRKAWSVFSAGLVGLAALVMVFALWQAGVFSGKWNQRDLEYGELGDWLAEHGAAQAVIMVGDAPAFTWHTGHMAIAVPNEPLETILAVADRYGARYLVLDDARPRTTDELYAGQTSDPHLILRHTARTDDGVRQLYEITGGDQP